MFFLSFKSLSRQGKAGTWTTALIVPYVLKVFFPAFTNQFIQFSNSVRLVVVFNPVLCLNSFNYCGPPFLGEGFVFFFFSKFNPLKNSVPFKCLQVHLSPEIIHQIAILEYSCWFPANHAHNAPHLMRIFRL